MSTLLLELHGNKTFNRTIWPPHLKIFDDLLIYKKRKWFGVREMSISYSQIAQCSLTKTLFFGHLEIVTTGTDDILVKFVSKRAASQAKKIIDQKIYHSHAKHETVKASDTDTGEIKSYEKSLNRLKELLIRGQISENEYEKKKNHLLKELR